MMGKAIKLKHWVLQERLGEVPQGPEDHRSGGGRNEQQHMGNDNNKQTGQAEHGQGGH